MKIHTLAAVLALGMFAVSQAAVQATFYVSPTGSGDYSSGSPGSLSGIQAKVRTVNGNMTGDIIVYLKGGTYTLTSPLAFGPNDGGSGANIVAYRNAPGEKPIISGGKQVTGWTQHSGNIWKATLTGVNKKIRNMFVNGVRADMARGPAAVPALGGWGTYAGALGISRYDGIKFSSSKVGIYANPGLIEIHSKNKGASCENSYCVRDMVSEGGFTVCKMAQPSFSIAQDQEYWAVVYVDTVKWSPGENNNWWDSTVGHFNFFNAYEFLDQPGEFYYNPTQNTLFYIPRTGEDLASADVEVGVAGNLFDIKGTSLTNRVKNIQFWGITFQYDDWQMQRASAGADSSYGYFSHDFDVVNYRSAPLHPGEAGFNDGFLYSAFSNMTTPHATINVESADNIDIEWCVMKHTGQLGISLKNDASNCKIVGNVFYDLGGGAVNVGHPSHVVIGDSSTQYFQEYGSSREGMCKNNRVQNNLVHDVSVHFRGQPGITGAIVESMNVSHNELYNLPYSGVVMGWANRGYEDMTVPWAPNVLKNPNVTMRNDTINYNRIHDVLQRLLDGGAIYTCCMCYMPGTMVLENYLYGTGAVVYLDYMSLGMIEKHNVMPPPADPGDMWDACDTIANPDWVCTINNWTQDQSVKDNAGLEACYKLIGSEAVAPQPGEGCTATAISQQPAGIVAVKPAVTKIRVFDLRGRLIANFDHPSIRTSMLRGPARSMSAGIVVVKTEFAAGSGKRSVLAVVK